MRSLSRALLAFIIAAGLCHSAGAQDEIQQMEEFLFNGTSIETIKLQQDRKNKSKEQIKMVPIKVPQEHQLIV